MSNEIDVDEFLAHHGVKGMRWGRHTAGSDSGGGSSPSPRAAKKADKKAARDANDKEILTARANLAKKDAKLSDAAVRAATGKTQKGRDAANAVFKKLADDYDNDPQHIKAAELTGKEKVKNNIEIAGWGALAAGLLVANVALRR